MPRKSQEAIENKYNKSAKKILERNVVRCPPESEQIIEEREKWRHDLLGFCKAVFPETFVFPWAPCHIDTAEKMMHIIENGGNQAIAQPRGSGKSSLASAAAIWAILYGKKRYGAIIAADQGAAERLLNNIRTEMWVGAGLGKYWPRLREYIEKGDGQAQKFRHLLNPDGSPPLIKWGKDKIALPQTNDPRDEWAGAVIQARGLTSGVRGMQERTSVGETLRPDFALIDDPSTADSASSVTQNNNREEIIQGDIMGLAGPGKDISVFMLCTVIRTNDLADRFLNPKIHPEWYPVRIPMIESYPDEKDGLWEEYRITYLTALRDGRDPGEARDFYRENREAMDKGGKVYWEDRKTPKDVSALQHAMDLRIRLGNAFLAEYQNQPIEHTGGMPYIIDTVSVMEKVNGLSRLVLPDDAAFIVSMTDINYSGLNTVVIASTNNAVRYIIDYQTFPGGNRPLYDPKDALKKKASDQVAISTALSQHIPNVASTRYMQQNGKSRHPDLVLIDCGAWMDLVFRWCQANAHKIPSGRLYPSRGRNYAQYKPTSLIGQPGDGFHVADWEKRGRVLVHNADLWRMRAQKAFLLPQAVPGSLTLYGTQPTQHKIIADEVCAEVLEEYIEETEKGNKFFKWGRKVGAPNDKLDAIVGALAGLAWLGASETGLGAKPNLRKPRRKKQKPIRIKI